ncbi:MAG TPA: PaaI family thioesterase [Blastocatellia bacterium]|nr:PaaI family thioesterase [Blastocatellia bacterium]
MQMFEPKNSNYVEEIEQGFARQTVMEKIGAYLIRVEPGQVEIGLNFREDLTQQHGYLHAGIVTTIVDSACGFAAYSLMPPDSEVLTVEYKVNLVNPAKGERFIAIGRVIKPGRTLTVCSGEVIAMEGGEKRIIAMMQTTMIRLSNTVEKQAK